MKCTPPLALAGALTLGVMVSALAAPLGLPEPPVPADNPSTPAKVALGDRLFNDTRFSSTGKVACATCHLPGNTFTDGPKKVSEGINSLKGTRNAPTVVNAAYGTSQFWDGRSPSLEDQALHPFTNPIEMGLPSHEPILAVIRKDKSYSKAFKEVFGVSGKDITISHVTMAIAAFERTVVSGDSAFDRWFYGRDARALTDAQVRGYELFIGKARCVSCHVIEQTQAIFTDNRFHNVGVGISPIQKEVPGLVDKYLEAQRTQAEVDVAVLSDPRTSELGRFAVDRSLQSIGAFKTPTLRNIEKTGPYMHDGSLGTLREVLIHYNNGGVTQKDDPVNDFLSGGIRPLNLTDAELDDLEAFLKALTSPQYAAAPGAAGSK